MRKTNDSLFIAGLYSRLRRNTVPSKNMEGGLTLLEVLIALLVLSIGVVGIGVLHVQALKFAHSSYHSSIAAAAALDMEERLWVALANSSTSCLVLEDVTDLLVELEGVWSGTAPGNVVIPGLQISPPRALVLTPFTEVGASFRWTDSRFENGAVSFPFTARTVCFVPPPSS